MIRKLFIPLLGLAFLAMALRSAAAYSYVPNQVLIKWHTGATFGCRDSALTALTAAVVDSMPDLHYYVVQLADTNVCAAVTSLSSCHCADDVQRNCNYGELLTSPPDAPNDSLYQYQWYLENTSIFGADIGAREGWKYVHESRDIIVAVMDKGIGITNVDLDSVIFTNSSEIGGGSNQDLDNNTYAHDVHGWDFLNHDNDADDDVDPYDPHGTAVASILGAQGNNGKVLTGVTWRTQILPVKIFQKDAGSSPGTRSVSELDLYRAFHYAVDMGAKIINCSWKRPNSVILQGMMNYARDNGVLIVAAAGDDGGNNDTTPIYPASYSNDNIISVTQTDIYDKLNTVAHPCTLSTALSNTGPTSVDMGAPGCDCYADYVLGPSPHHAGSSISAAVVSGAAALLWQQNPTWTYLQVKNRLMDTVTPLATLTSQVVTGGRVNIGRALDNVAPADPGLVFVSGGRHEIALGWTDPGDDGSETGQAKTYDLRYSTSNITNDTQFNAASHAPVTLGSPDVATTPHCVTVTGLSGCTTYYFALKVEDDALNKSSFTTVSGTTACSGNELSYCDYAGSRPNEARSAPRLDEDANASWALGLASPNPSKNKTVIMYSMKRQGRVSIRLYDAGGRLVRTIVEDTVSPGPHSVIWSGTDSEDRQVGRGVYFYRMEADEFQAERRIVYLGH